MRKEDVCRILEETRTIPLTMGGGTSSVADVGLMEPLVTVSVVCDTAVVVQANDSCGKVP